jgi:hypothetical protein
MIRRWLTIIVMGWYLMGPPFDDKGVILPDAPLKKWSHVESFDSARECEANQSIRFQRASAVLSKMQDDMRTGKVKVTDAYSTVAGQWAFASRSQCINSSDPRLR